MRITRTRRGGATSAARWRTTPWASTSEDQSVQAGNFMWTDHAHARCIEFEAGTERQRFVGEHYGYQRLEDPVVHRREIVCDARRQLIDVIDMLRCDGEHRARRAWHFAEDCQVERGWAAASRSPPGSRRCSSSRSKTLDSMRGAPRWQRRAGRLGVAQLRAQAAMHDGRTGIRASPVSRCCARASRTRGHAPLASEPAISRSRPAPGRHRRRARAASAPMRCATTTASACSTKSATSTPRRAARRACIAAACVTCRDSR